MGKQTDAHIVTVTAELGKLEKALEHMETARSGYAKIWTDTMGSNTPGKFQSALDTGAATYKTSITDAKTALAAAKKALVSMDTFVTQKDKNTWNPLAKKSIGKAKKFVANAKGQLAEVETKLALPDTSGFNMHVAVVRGLMEKMHATA